MNPPWLFTVLPQRLQAALYYRRYHPPPERWHRLFEAAPLAYAPEMRMRLVPGDVGHGSIAFTGFYELALTRRLVRRARAGGLFVDVGANAGYFSLLWAAANPGNRVIALEPSPRVVDLLRENVSHNGLAARIAVHAWAASKSAGRFPFDLGPPEQTGWGGFALTPSANTISVEAVRLDELVPADVRVEAIKIDVEGADPWVLRGSERLLRERRVGVVFYEQNTHRLRKLGIRENEARDFLGSVGYQAAPLEGSSPGSGDWFAVPVG